MERKNTYVNVKNLKVRIIKAYPMWTDLILSEPDELSIEAFLELSRILLTLMRKERNINLHNRINKGVRK